MKRKNSVLLHSLFSVFLWGSLSLTMVCGFALYCGAQDTEADLIIINSKVITVDRDFSIKQAIAVAIDALVAVDPCEARQ